MPTIPVLRRLRRGPVSVELEYDDLHMILACAVHGEERRVPFGDEGVSEPVIAFFREHITCSAGAQFDIEEDP